MTYIICILQYHVCVLFSRYEYLVHVYQYLLDLLQIDKYVDLATSSSTSIMGVSASSEEQQATAAGAGATASSSSTTMSSRRAHHPASVPASVITAAALPASDDVISPHLRADLPHHIVECPLLPGSGRTMRSYRVRHVDTGAVVVVRAMVVRYEADGAAGAGAGVAGSGSGSAAPEHPAVAVASRGGGGGGGDDGTSKRRLPTESQIRENLRRQEEELAKLRDIASDVGGHPNVQTFLHWFAPDPVKAESYRQAAATFNLPAYLLRPHVHSTLRDRLESRPFLSTIEKNWVAHQILRALDGLHGAAIRHGHLTCENVGMTSWGWVLLTDVATYKPVSVPDDDPSDFIAHYQERSAGVAAATVVAAEGGTGAAAESGGGGGGGGGGARGERQRCYLAPERFFARREGEKPATEVTDAMDIFSAGCVLIEMFLNGERTFDLGDLMEYRRDRKMLPAVQQKLNKIESSAMRAACKHMLSLDPRSRLTAAQYLERLTSEDAGESESRRARPASDVPAAPMPLCFDSVLFPLLKRLRCQPLSPDARIALAAAHYGTVVRATVGLVDAWGERYFEELLGSAAVALERGSGNGKDRGESQKAPACAEEQPPALDNDALLKETEELLRCLEMSGILASKSSKSREGAFDVLHDADDNGQIKRTPILRDDIAEQFDKITMDGQNLSPSASAIVIFVELVRSSIRHVQRPSSKLVSLQLLRRLIKVTSDEIRLHRIVPSVVFLLQDSEAMVRAAAISALASILVTIKSFPPSDSQLFPQYIFKRVEHCASDPSLTVRDAFARSISVLAVSALRFLDIGNAIKINEVADTLSANALDNNSAVPAFSDAVTDELLGGDTSSGASSPNKQVAKKGHDYKKPSDLLIQSTYESDLASLRNTVSRWVVTIATDASETAALPKRSLLCGIAQLCSFFGLEGVLTYVLPQVLAFLNDRRDWQLRALLCQRLPSICVVIGRASTAHFVIPCIETALVDSNERVVCCAISCLTELNNLGLITRAMLLGGSKIGKSGPGIIEKYSVMCVHPSACIRNEYVSLFSSSFSSLGSPDDVVFLLPIIRPFIRYEPPRNHLTDASNLTLCLLPPMSRERFDMELSQVTSVILNGSETSATNSSTVKSSSGRDQRRSDPDGRMASLLALDSSKEYLEMLYRKKRASEQAFAVDYGGDALDGASRYSYSCFVPNQKLAELMKDPLPEWYDSMRELERASSSDFSGRNADSSHVSLRSLTSLGGVYGCSITQPMTSSFRPKANHAFLDIMHGDDLPLDAEGHIARESALTFIGSDESKSFGAAVRGEWGSVLHLDAVLTDNAHHAANFDSMRCPPLPPSLGVLREEDGRAFSWHLSGGSNGSSSSPGSDPSSGHRQSEWKPKIDALVASSSPITEHNDAIVRLALSQDQSFFVTASHDGTCRVFELGQVEESVGDLRSCVVYAGHSSAENQQQGSPVRINDITMVENGHSVASAASNGSVHVWRVDQVSSKRSSLPGSSDARVRGDLPASSLARNHRDHFRVSGSSVVRTLNPQEGEVLAINHFNTDNASTVVFATQKGVIHSWDLRCAAEPFKMSIWPELGHLTSMAVGHDRKFMVAGTNKGCLALFDIRYQRCVRLWQHSSAAPIARLAASFTSLRHDKASAGEPRPYIFMGCGKNEASVFDITDGSCKQCFRVLDSDLCYVDRSALPQHCVTPPQLHEIPLSSQRPLRSSGDAFGALTFNERVSPPEPRILSLIGRVGSSGQPFLLTGGSDCCIRYWSLAASSKCYTFSGLSNCQPRLSCESINIGPSSRLFLCRQMPVATAGEMEGGKVPRKLERGQIRPENCHTDAILDLKLIDRPMKGVLSASRDGCVKVWR